MPSVLFNKIGIIGMGLLGGSLGLAAKQRNVASRVACYVRRESAIEEVLDAGAADEASMNLEEVVSNADLIILCTPLGQMVSLAEQIIPFLKSGAIVTDVGSAKQRVDSSLTPLFGKSHASFIGSHPMAGGEKTGVAAAREDLFQDATCAICPGPASPKLATESLTRFWEKLGTSVLSMTPGAHDKAVSRISHLPHAVASAMACLGLDSNAPSIQRSLCATGFADLTRVASGSPEMWHDISIQNREHLADATDALIELLKQFSDQLRANDSNAIQALFERAKELRDQWMTEAASNSGMGESE
ncbi:prephenate dehydrogenase/arogenate dehydrogenase family protein [Verrucomicrobia bacterium]|nr:prephenate dehydrogenase/arogenate dehydrogenase family protein [Verrucomicrobiota bacterium]